MATADFMTDRERLARELLQSREPEDEPNQTPLDVGTIEAVRRATKPPEVAEPAEPVKPRTGASRGWGTEPEYRAAPPKNDQSGGEYFFEKLKDFGKAALAGTAKYGTRIQEPGMPPTWKMAGYDSPEKMDEDVGAVAHGRRLTAEAEDTSTYSEKHPVRAGALKSLAQAPEAAANLAVPVALGAVNPALGMGYIVGEGVKGGYENTPEDTAGPNKLFGALMGGAQAYAGAKAFSLGTRGTGIKPYLGTQAAGMALSQAHNPDLSAEGIAKSAVENVPGALMFGAMHNRAAKKQQPAWQEASRQRAAYRQAKAQEAGQGPAAFDAVLPVTPMSPAPDGTPRNPAPTRVELARELLHMNKAEAPKAALTAGPKAEALPALKAGPKAGGIAHGKTPLIEKLEAKGVGFRGDEPMGIVRITEPTAVKDVGGQRHTLPKGEEIRSYPLTNGQYLVQDGVQFVANKNQLQALKGRNLELGQQPMGDEFADVKMATRGDDAPARKAAQAELERVRGENIAKYGRQATDWPQEAMDEYNAATSKLNDTQWQGGNVKFQSYVVPGGENYREVLIQAPKVEQQNPPKIIKSKDGKYRIKNPDGSVDESRFWSHISGAQLGLQGDLQRSDFRSSHWDEPNVLAHARLTDRTTPDGKRVLFIEEIQSDWALARRKNGPETERPVMNENNLDGRTSYKTGTPDHPYLKNWQENTLKRILKMAADEGYDGVSWATGEQTAGHYDLSKQVDRIGYRKDGPDTYEVSAVKGGESVITQHGKTAKELEEFVGKDVAQKIVNGEGVPRAGGGNVKDLSGLDLKVGGEWARSLYDVQIPSILGKLTKKAGGKVEKTALGSGKAWKVTNNIDEPTATFDNYDAAKAFMDARIKKWGRRFDIRPLGGVGDQGYLELTPQVKEIIQTGGQPMAGGKMHGKRPGEFEFKVGQDVFFRNRIGNLKRARITRLMTESNTGQRTWKLDNGKILKESELQPSMALTGAKAYRDAIAQLPAKKREQTRRYSKAFDDLVGDQQIGRWVEPGEAHSILLQSDGNHQITSSLIKRLARERAMQEIYPGGDPTNPVDRARAFELIPFAKDRHERARRKAEGKSYEVEAQTIAPGALFRTAADTYIAGGPVETPAGERLVFKSVTREGVEYSVAPSEQVPMTKYIGAEAERNTLVMRQNLAIMAAKEKLKLPEEKLQLLLEDRDGLGKTLEVYRERYKHLADKPFNNGVLKIVKAFADMTLDNPDVIAYNKSRASEASATRPVSDQPLSLEVGGVAGERVNPPNVGEAGIKEYEAARSRTAQEVAGALSQPPSAEAPKADPKSRYNMKWAESLDPSVKDGLVRAMSKNQVPDFQRRITIAEIEARGRESGISWNEINRLKKGDILTPEKMAAVQNLYAYTYQRLESLKSQPLEKTTGAEAEIARLTSDFFKLTEVIQASKSQAGRALSTGWRMNTTPMDAVNAALGKMLNELPPDKVTILKERWAALPSENIEAKIALIRELTDRSWFDKIIEYRNASLLTGPITHLANITGNTATMVYTPAEMLTTGGVDFVRSTLTGKPRERFFGEVPQYIRGAMTFKAVRNTIKALLDENYRSSKSNKASELIGRAPAIKGTKGKVIRMPFRLLSAMDELFRTMNREGFLRAHEYRNRKMGGKLTPEQIVEGAEAQAAENIFQEPLGSVAGLANKLRTADGVAGFVSKLTAPFWNTPVNLVKYGARRSPLGVLSPKNIKDVMAGGGKASEAVARVLLGTAISAALTRLALDGGITGRGPDDMKERSMLIESGWKPYSIKIGKEYYSYKRIEPINKLLMLAAATAEAWKSKDSMAADKLLGRIVFDVSRSILDTSYLQGMNDLFDAMTEPVRHGGRYIRRMAASFVPSASRWLTTTYFDDEMKDPQSFMDEVKAKVPGLSDDVFPRRNVFGEPMKQPKYLGGVLPVAVSETNPDPIFKEIYKLMKPQQGSGPQVGLPSRKVGKWEIPPDVYDKMVEQGGAEFKQGVVDRIGEYSDFWDVMEPGDKIDAINQAHREAWGSYRDFTGVRGEFWPEIRERLVKDGVPEDDIEAWEYNELVVGDKLYGDDDEEFED